MKASGLGSVHAAPLFREATITGRGSAQPGSRSLPVDHAGAAEPGSATYDEGSVKARGKGAEDTGSKGSKEWTDGQKMLATAAVNITLLALLLVIGYYIEKGAVHNGIRAAVRDGSLGNSQNRVAANQ